MSVGSDTMLSAVVLGHRCIGRDWESLRLLFGAAKGLSDLPDQPLATESFGV